MEKYQRSPPPALAVSQEKYLQEELKKLERVIESMYEEILRLKTANSLL